MSVSSRSDELTASAAAPLAPALPRKGWLKLSPVNQRRLDNFRRNRRGYWSFWIFSVLFVLSLFAEVIAIHRGHLDLAEARRAEANGDRALAEANRVYARLRVLDAHDPSTRSGNVTEPPILLRSDDARIAVRILERAISAAE